MSPTTVHRDVKLSSEVNTIVLKLVQLRDTHKNNINSVQCEGKELGSIPDIASLKIGNLSVTKKKSLCNEIGYSQPPRGKKCDIIINGKRTAIRCMNYTDRALVNHSTRPKYEKVCNRIGLAIDELDSIIDHYIERRKNQFFNEDCFYYSTLNPFIPHKEYLKELLTFMAFHSFNYNKDYNSPQFITDKVDYILDFVDPLKPETWKTYGPSDYFESIWTSLCFSLRDNKGMPSDDVLFKPGNESILRWNYPYLDETGKIRNKAALHIRIKKYDSTQMGKPFEEQFVKEIKTIKQNKGERDEYLLKLFLIECRQKSVMVPLGDSNQIVKNVGSKTQEYGRLHCYMDWKKLEAEELISICASVYATKAGMYEKADVYINGIGVSVKSERGANPSIINHTTRDKILRVMNAVNAPIAPLDQMVNKYWSLRLTAKIKEDVAITEVNCPFSKPDETYCLNVLKPLINYFAFDGTGTKDSKAPAQYILSLTDPTDTKTWTYYDKKSFIYSVWKYLVFSIRSKSTPQSLDPNNQAHQMMKEWIRECDGMLKGSLSVRVGSPHND